MNTGFNVLNTLSTVVFGRFEGHARKASYPLHARAARVATRINAGKDPPKRPLLFFFVIRKNPMRCLPSPPIVAASAVPYRPVYRARKQTQIWICASLAGARRALSVCVSCGTSHSCVCMTRRVRFREARSAPRRLLRGRHPQEDLRSGRPSAPRRQTPTNTLRVPFPTPTL